VQLIRAANSLTAESIQHEILTLFQTMLLESYANNRNVAWKGGHDEGTYLTAFREYYLHTGDSLVSKYVFELIDQAAAWGRKHLHNGYYPFQEVHHGIENYVIFYAWAYELDPNNPNLRELLLKAAANLLNPPKQPKWFDWDRNRFTSCFLGTKRIWKKFTVNIPEHLRLIRLAWLGLAAGGDKQLGTLIKNYTKEWAQLMAESSELTIALPQGKSADKETKDFEKAIQKFVGAAPKQITPQTRSEYHIANGTPALFLTLYEHTHEKCYLDAVTNIIRPVLSQLASPYAHPLGEHAWQLFQMGGLPELPEIIPQLQADVDKFCAQSFQLVFNPEYLWKTSPFKDQIGIRKDMPAVEFQNLETHAGANIPSPATLGLLYRMTGEAKYLTLALEVSMKVLLEAKTLYGEGRPHGCSSQFIHSFCVGHGRNWGAGYTSTALRVAKGKNCFNIALPTILNS
jgi:hypothetical protein